MSHLPLNAPARSPKAFPSHILARAARMVDVPPTKPRAPYEVERHPAIDGGTLLVGFDGRGEVMIELRIRSACYPERMIEKMRRWMREHDTSPPAMEIVP